MTALHRALGLLALASIAGCLGTPQPDPPNLAPERIRGMGGERGGAITVTGERGAARAAAPAELLLANLDAPATPVRVVPVAADGSFVVSTVTMEGDALRLWVRDADGERSAPLDVLVDGDRLVRAVRVLTCLQIEPRHHVVLGSAIGGEVSDVITLVNTCAAEVVVESVALRATIGGVTIESAPTRVAPGGSAEIELRFQPLETEPAGPVEDVLLVTVTDGTERDRRAVTVVAEVR